MCLATVEGLSVLDGRFTTIQRIDQEGGTGNFSLVFRARDLVSNRDVALKFYNPQRLGNHYREACFEREAKVLEGLGSHRDIIRLVAPRSTLVTPIAGPWPIALFYYATELATSDLQQELARGPQPPLRSLKLFRAMCRAVQRSHSRRIAHRDLKPSNFLLARSGALKLADFGCARAIDGPAIAPAYSGPPGDLRYAAPELIAILHDSDPHLAINADCFALGAMLFELFTGTLLTVHLYDSVFLGHLLAVMGAIPSRDRRRIYEGFLGNIVAARPLPNIRDVAPSVPWSIVGFLDSLYKDLAALDYRVRLCDFGRIFRRLETCFIILRNEEEYRRWRAQRAARRGSPRAGGIMP